MKKIAFIINPISRRNIKADLESFLLRTCAEKHYAVSLHYSESYDHLYRLAKEAVAAGIEIIVAVGGDGTVHQVAKALAGSNSALGIIPIGSGNGLARHFKISGNFQKALDQIFSAAPEKIDTMIVNGKFCLNIAGVGFDGIVSQTFVSSHLRGLLSYLWIGTKEYFSYLPKEYVLSIDNGRKTSFRAFVISICNGSQYGNNAIAIPEAKVDDGQLNVLICKPFPFWAVPLLFIRLFTGTLRRSRYIKTFICKKMTIETKEVNAHLDGEAVDFPSPINISVNPQSLWMLHPVVSKVGD